MCYSKIFDAVGNGSQDDGTLYSLSDEFLEAARVLQATPPFRVNYSSVTYYLLGHAAELMLKAFLCKHGQTIGDLKNINHNLNKLSSLAREKGLPEEVRLDQIALLADTYFGKDFEYRTRKKKTLPSFDHLTEEIEILQSAVFNSLH